MKYWVYEHIFPNGKRYIGLTTNNNPKQRWKGGSAYKGQLVFKAIQKYGWKNIKHLLYECDSEKEMKYLERYLIAYYNTTDKKNGYNITPGGDYNVSPQAYKIVRQLDFYGNEIAVYKSIVYAAQMTGVRKDGISACARLKRPSAGGFVWRFEGDDTPCVFPKTTVVKKPVLQFTKQGVFIKEYESVLAAATAVGSTSCKAISYCCDGKRYFHTCKGFVWKWK